MGVQPERIIGYNSHTPFLINWENNKGFCRAGFLALAAQTPHAVDCHHTAGDVFGGSD